MSLLRERGGGVSSVWGWEVRTAMRFASWDYIWNYVELYVELCMVPGHSCHIYRIWRSNELGDALKPSFWVAMQARRRWAVFMGKGGSLLY